MIKLIIILKETQRRVRPTKAKVFETIRSKRYILAKRHDRYRPTDQINDKLNTNLYKESSRKFLAVLSSGQEIHICPTIPQTNGKKDVSNYRVASLHSKRYHPTYIHYCHKKI